MLPPSELPGDEAGADGAYSRNQAEHATGPDRTDDPEPENQPVAGGKHTGNGSQGIGAVQTAEHPADVAPVAGQGLAQQRQRRPHHARWQYDQRKGRQPAQNATGMGPYPQVAGDRRQQPIHQHDLHRGRPHRETADQLEIPVDEDRSAHPEATTLLATAAPEPVPP